MRRTVHALAATLVAAATVTLTAGPALAKSSPPTANPHSIKTSPYVALGDSYSSAAGVPVIDPTAPATCSRSFSNYPRDIAAVTKPAVFTDATCSGATTQDFFTSQADGVAPQLDAVTKNTRLVTMTIGGNDEGVFAATYFGCYKLTATDPDGNPCQQANGDTFDKEVRQQTYPNLVRALTAVHRKAPAATVAILGYPEILPPTWNPGCAAMGLAKGDVSWLYQQDQVLNAVVAKAARVTGTRFIDMKPSSTGHDACQLAGTRWIEPLVTTPPAIAFPVHPNATGEAAMAHQTVLQLGLLARSGRH